MIKVGDALPAATLMEYSEVEGEGCSIGPNAVDVAKATAGKTVAVFGLPGAFTPTCSTKQLPAYDKKYRSLTAKKNNIDEVYCLSVNDGFVMNAWFESLGIKNVKPLASSHFRHMRLSINGAFPFFYNACEGRNPLASGA